MERTAQAFPCLWVSASPWLCAIPAVALSIHAEHSCRADSVWSQAECLGWPASIGDQCPGRPSPFHPFSFCRQLGQQLVAGNLSFSWFVRSRQGVEPFSSFDRTQLCKLPQHHPALHPQRWLGPPLSGQSHGRIVLAGNAGFHDGGEQQEGKTGENFIKPIVIKGLTGGLT